ncbi:MAG: hypothetical protein COY40_01535 [Alphaproteobacteria bacterium CG_4_10_14_0_8_um_filter_53_9]|nr:MAG: hypothetical protein COY40_01535 [Alphaproteobacteria bacterium CG_4_10_14_0_8_um_filter_53_9]
MPSSCNLRANLAFLQSQNKKLAPPKQKTYTACQSPLSVPSAYSRKEILMPEVFPPDPFILLYIRSMDQSQVLKTLRKEGWLIMSAGNLAESMKNQPRVFLNIPETESAVMSGLTRLSANFRAAHVWVVGGEQETHRLALRALKSLGLAFYEPDTGTMVQQVKHLTAKVMKITNAPVR